MLRKTRRNLVKILEKGKAFDERHDVMKYVDINYTAEEYEADDSWPMGPINIMVTGTMGLFILWALLALMVIVVP